jgi:hypothetical protein
MKVSILVECKALNIHKFSFKFDSDNYWMFGALYEY